MQAQTVTASTTGRRRLTPTAAAYLIGLMRTVGFREAGHVAAQHVWGERSHLGLRCDLAKLPPVPAALVEVTMREQSPGTFSGFGLERGRVTGSDLGDVMFRILSLQSGVKTLYAAEIDGEPVYCQWLIRREHQPALDALSPGCYLPLQQGEVLLENAYTFTRFRGCSAMAAGMSQLLHLARLEGARMAFTYVAADNVPSLRGCGRVGFLPDHWRTTRTVLGRRTTTTHALDAGGRAAWSKATS